MLGIIGEQLNHTTDISKVLSIGLEQISLLKDIPFCAWCDSEQGELVIQKAYTLFSNEELTGRKISLSDSVRVILQSGTTLLCNKECQSLLIDELFPEKFRPKTILLIPFPTLFSESSLFLFADNSKDDQLVQFSTLLHRITEQIAARIDNLTLIEELKTFNSELDYKVEERTRELMYSNQALEGEIIERQSIEDELRASESRFRNLVENATDAFFVVRKDGTFVDFNRQACKSLGYSRKELFKLTVPHLDQNFSTAQFSAHFKEVTTKKSVLIQSCHARKDGSSFPVEIKIGTFKKGNKTYLLALARDISERKDAQVKLERWQHMFEHIKMGIAISDGSDGTLDYMNPAYASLHGYTVEELVGKPVNHVYAPAVREDLPEIIKKINKLGHLTFESIHQHKDGTTFPVLMNITVVKDEDGEMLYRVANVQDISIRKNLEEQLLQAQKMEAVGRLSGGIAHDFNNLLTSIIGYSELSLLQMSDDNPLQETFEQIHIAGKKAAVLTKQLLAFSRKQVLKMEPVNLNELVSNMTKMLSRLIGEDISLSINLTANAATVKADPGQLEQVLMNLTVNARDAMPDGGKLSIETDVVILDESYTANHEDVRPGQYLILAVADSGEGMEKEIQKKIFEPFFTTKHKSQGTGLGLATVFGIVKQHRGHIFVYSELGKGSTFKVYIPASSEIKSKGILEGAPKVNHYGNECILVVDDDFGVRNLVSASLRHLGYTVISVSSGEEAIRIAEDPALDFDLLLTDVIMAGMNGRELAERVQKIRPGKKTIFMSGYTDNIIAHHGVLDPGMEFINKPIIPSQLAVRIRRILDESINKPDK